MRVLLLNIGNTSLFGGVITLGRLECHFRVPIAEVKTEAKLRRFLAAEARGKFDRAALCSVVPELTLPLCAAVKRAVGNPAEKIIQSDRRHRRKKNQLDEFLCERAAQNPIQSDSPFTRRS